MATMQVPKESGHWYSQAGAPAYEVPYKDPKKGMRNTTLADARKEKFVPSVTGITKLLPKDGLVRWEKEQIFYAALTLTREEGESDQQFYYRVIADSKEQAKKAAEKGTAIHGAIQRCLADQSYDARYENIVEPIMDWLMLQFGKTSWISERTFAHPLGFGGAVDLHSPQVVIDFKTKDFDQSDIDNGKVKGWPEHGMQLAAYREGVGHPNARRINLFVSRNNPGLVHPYYWDEKDWHWETFKAALELWKLIKGYDSSFEGQA